MSKHKQYLTHKRYFQHKKIDNRRSNLKPQNNSVKMTSYHCGKFKYNYNIHHGNLKINPK